MSKVIAYSLWGTNPKYTVGAIENVKYAKQIFPEWECRFFVATNVEPHIKHEIIKCGGEIVEMGEAGWNAMFWRFLVADSNDTMISRDTDSRPSYREKAAVDEWLASDKDFHIMRDHPYHDTAILGGMWGVRNGLLIGLSDMIKDYDAKSFDDKYQVDQNFLREVVYPLVKDNVITHDEFFDHKPFPPWAPKWIANDFVGQVYNQFNEPEFS